jgi:hypothetical protein
MSILQHIGTHTAENFITSSLSGDEIFSTIGKIILGIGIYIFIQWLRGEFDKKDANKPNDTGYSDINRIKNKNPE